MAKRINPSHSDIQSVLTSGIQAAIDDLEKGSSLWEAEYSAVKVRACLEELLVKAAKMQIEREQKVALRAEKQAVKAAKAEARKAVGRKATLFPIKA